MPTVPALFGKPGRAFFQQVTHPVKGFEVLHQRRPTKQPDLGNEGRA